MIQDGAHSIHLAASYSLESKLSAQTYCVSQDNKAPQYTGTLLASFPALYIRFHSKYTSHCYSATEAQWLLSAARLVYVETRSQALLKKYVWQLASPPTILPNYPAVKGGRR